MRIRASLTTIVVALSGLVAAAPAAEAGPEGRDTSVGIQQTTGPQAFGLLRNGATGRCLEERPDRTVGTGANPCNGSSAQKWQWQFLNSGPVLVNERSRLCLTGLFPMVYTSTCNQPAYQRFDHHSTGQLKLYWNQNHALDSDANGAAYMHQSNDGNFQKWSWG